MGVVIFLGLSAAIVLKFYRWITRSDPEGKSGLYSIKQQAATVASLAGAVFDVISAVTTAKITVSRTMIGPQPPKPIVPATGLRFGTVGHSFGPGGTPDPA